MKRVVGSVSSFLRRGYALLFAFVFIFYIGLAVLAPRLMISGHETAGKVIYKVFHFLCHQYPWRSWFLGGEQAYYPLSFSDCEGMLSIDEAAGMQLAEIDPRSFYGNPQMGYKMAACQRDIAIYGAMCIFCLVFFLSKNRMHRVDWRLWLLFGVLPMAFDGLWQLGSQVLPLLPLRESTPFMRTVTGALFGFFTCWYLLPTLEKMLREGANDACQ
ncbi:MAG: DUF2085 domain-containing protein [Flexilinea sp.]|nr:DUF2085 domain-containing protein [Flexilinea sp.]